MSALADLIGDSAAVRAVRAQVTRLLERAPESRRLPPVLIEGETGTGKGLLARAIHRAGPRGHAAFVDVNCAAIPETLLEAEMFGFERGAFTDARQAKPGLFETAHGGTLFLDEVGSLPDATQAKLLKAIEERIVRRLGSTTTRPVDVWIVCATSDALENSMRTGRFRPDLYHRLAVFTVRLPPLRERGADILVLADHFLARTCADYQLPAKTFDGSARAVLRAHAWPGNVRELANVTERAALLSEGAAVSARDLALPVQLPGWESEYRTAHDTRRGDDAPAAAERERLLATLQQTNWNLSQAANRLRMPRNTLRYRMERHSLRPAPPSRRRATRAVSADAGREGPMTPAAPSIALAHRSPEHVAPHAGVKWERRRLALLRAVVVAPPVPPTGFDISRALGVIAEKLNSFGGAIVELEMSAIVAVFGREPVEDAPRRAALAAIAIQKTAERASRRESQAPAAKIAIHVAECSLGTVGATITVDAESQRRASRVLESVIALAAPGVILATSAAAPVLDRRFDIVAAGELSKDGGRVYRLTGLERAGFGPAGRITPFVGRAQELEWLRSRLAAAMDEQGQVVGIVGDAGIGKSRLIFELCHDPRARAAMCVEGRCFSYATATPYLPIVTILRQLCGVREADGPETIRETVHRLLTVLEMTHRDSAPYLLELLGVATDFGGSSPDMVKARTFDTLRTLMLQTSSRRHLVVVVEDLHWIDTTSEEFLAALVDSIAGAHILLIATYRPGYRPPWLVRSYAAQVTLSRLSHEESLDVVRAALPPEHASGEAAQRILVRGEGNPFFLEELSRAIVERRGADDTAEVPATVEEVLAARLARLEPAERWLLQAASVIGRDVPYRLLCAIADEPEHVVAAQLARLQAAEFLNATSAAPNHEYTFKHALTHEVTYCSLPPEPRRKLHAAIFETLETLYRDRLAEQIERLAHHAFSAELWQKAVMHLRQAGAKAFARSANRESVMTLEQALVAVSHLPETRETLEQAIDLRFELRSSLFPLVELDRIDGYLREAQTLASRLGDRRRLGWTFFFMSHYLWIRGRTSEAASAAADALAVGEEHDDFRLRVAGTFFRGRAALARGDYRSAEHLLGDVVRLVGPRHHERCGLVGFPAVQARAWLAWSLSERGELGEALENAREAIRIAEELDHAYSRVLAYWGRAYSLRVKGDFTEGARVAEFTVELAARYNISAVRLAVAGHLGYFYAVLGRAAEGVELIAESVRCLEAMGVGAYHLFLVVQLAESLMRLERLDEAEAAAGRVLELARARAERGDEAYAYRVLGEVASRRQPTTVAAAQSHYMNALALAGDLGMRPLVAHCHLGLGKLYHQIDHRDKAASHLEVALGMFRDMNMTSWGDHAAAGLTSGTAART